MNNAFDCAVGLLRRRDHGAKELVEKLKQKGYPVEESTAALYRCQELGYQNEDRYVASFCQLRIQQGYGPLRIIQELQFKKVDDEIVQHYFDQANINWQENAEKVIRKKFKRLATPRTIEWQKQLRFLIYRGFSPNHLHFDACE